MILLKVFLRFDLDLGNLFSAFDRFRAHITDFIRNRKFGYQDTFLFLISRLGISNTMELMNYFDQKGVDVSMSTTALKNQRMKLMPEIFLYILDGHNHNFYEDKEDVQLYKGHLIIAIDGSDITLPTTERLMKEYGYSQGQENHRRTAMASLSCACDVINGMVLDVHFDRYRTSERETAIEHLKEVEKKIKQPKIYVMDRGYFSFKLLNKFKTVNYVFRLGGKSLYKERKDMKSDDEMIELEFSKQRIYQEKDEETKEQMKEAGSTKVRITRIELAGGKTEYILSNLGEEYTKEDIDEIYAKRWGEETIFKIIKHHLKLENFSGVTPRLIEQDVYATIYVSNLIQDYWQEAQKTIEQEKYKEKKKINRNIEIGIWKRMIINIYTAESKEEVYRLGKEFENKIKKHMTTVKEKRHNERIMQKKPRKHHQNQKNSY